MRFTRVRPGVAFLTTAMPAVLILAQDLRAQDVDISGTWTLEIETDADPSTATVTLVQEGPSLTGQYSSEAFGQTEVAGTVEGPEFTFSFGAEVQGTPVTVTYSGTVESRFLPAGAPLQELMLRPLRAPGPALWAQGVEPMIFINGIRVDVGRTEELSGTFDLGGIASGTFRARREESR